MINIANAEYVFLLVLIPVFFIIYGVRCRMRKKKIAKIGDPQIVGQLMPSMSVAKGWVRVTLLSFAWLFFVIGLMRPQIGARLKEKETEGVEIMIALDVSNSMLAEDYSPNRLERAKLAIASLVDKLRDDRIGLVVFAGRSFVQLPITTDYVSAKMFLNSITTESVPVQGTALGDAITTSIRSFSMQSKSSRAIILITDGENHEDDPVEAAKNAAELGIRVFCVGVGSQEGKPIPFNGELLKDKDGEIVVTRLDEQTLQDVAEAGNGLYVRAGSGEFGLNPIVDDIRTMDAEKFQSVVFEDFDEQYMYFFVLAMIFFIIEMLIGERRINKKLFSVVMVFALSATMLNAQEDRKDVREGNRNFKREAYQKADISYRKALLKDSASVAANFNLANTQYMLGNYQSAAEYLGKIADSAVLGPNFPQHSYNSGNVSVQLKDYASAVEAYKKALRENPGDMHAKANLAYAQKMLENQQNQQNQDNQDNKENNQDQNKDQNKDQDQDQNKDNQNQDQNKDQNQDQDNNNQNNQDNQNSQNKISPQAAQQMLQAIQAKEKETQDKVKKEKAKLLKSKEKEKNW